MTIDDPASSRSGASDLYFDLVAVFVNDLVV